MSLNRVASLESLVIAPREARNRRDSVASYGSVRPNKLTFNPVPHPGWEETVEIETVAAFEVPKWKRLLQVGATVLYCLFSAGVVFGYAALKPVLKSEGAYQAVCANSPSPGTCVEIHLNFMFTVAAVASNLAALPIGSILDSFGPRVCGVLGSILIASGCLVMAFASHLRFDGYLTGYLLLALGGPAVFISSFQLSNAFPAHSGLILALLTGAFDASSALFFGYRLVYERTGGSISIRRFFLFYLIVPAVVFLLNLFLLPSQSYKTKGELVTDADAEEAAGAARASEESAPSEHAPLLAGEPDHRGTVATEVQDLLGSTHGDAQVRREARRNDKSGIWGAMHGVSAGQQLRSPWFILICLFTILQMTRINFFIATIRPQYEALLGSRSKAAAVNNFFDAALPFGGLLSVPFIGLLLDNTRSVTVIVVLVTVATTIGILGIIPTLTAAYANIALFVLYRPFYYAAVSDFAAKVFGFRTFGTVYGALISLSGAFGFSQYGLDYLFHVTFGGDPVPVNIILLSVAAGVGVVLAGYVGWQTKGMKRKMLGAEAASAFGFQS